MRRSSSLRARARLPSPRLIAVARDRVDEVLPRALGLRAHDLVRVEQAVGGEQVGGLAAGLELAESLGGHATSARGMTRSTACARSGAPASAALTRAWRARIRRRRAVVGAATAVGESRRCRAGVAAAPVVGKRPSSARRPGVRAAAGRRAAACRSPSRSVGPTRRRRRSGQRRRVRRPASTRSASSQRRHRRPRRSIGVLDERLDDGVRRRRRRARRRRILGRVLVDGGILDAIRQTSPRQSRSGRRLR